MADAPPLKITIGGPGRIAVDPDISGQSSGTVDADTFLGDSSAPASAPAGASSGTAPAYAPTEVPGTGTSSQPLSADDFLKNDAALNPSMSNEQILHSIGLPKARVEEIAKDPIYKTLNDIEPNFLAKEVADPGSTASLLKDHPAIGAFIQSADESAFGAARLLTHALASVGGIPSTSTDLMDAWSKVNDLSWENRNGISQQDYQNNYTVPKIAGAVALGAGPGLLASGVKAAAGLLGGAADTTLAAAAPNAVVTPLTAAQQVAKVGATSAGVGAAGATQAAAYNNPQVDFTASPQTRHDQYWSQTDDAAKQGALFAVGLHNIAAGGYAAAKWGISKSKSAQAIAQETKALLAHVPTTAEGFTNFMKNYAPLFAKKEFAEREANFAASGVNPKLSQITHGPLAKGAEKLFGGLPFGLSKFEGKQAGQLTQAAQRYSADVYDKMINTKFSGLADLQEAAKSGGPKSEAAQRILDEFQQAGLTPARVAQLSAEGEGIRKWLISRKKFAKVQELAAGAKMPVEKPLAKVNELIKDLAQRDNPDSGLLTKLTKIKTNLEGPNELNTYSRFEGRKEELAEMIKRYQGIPVEGKLIELQRAMTQAQHDFAENIHKYAKSERFGIAAKDTAPAFKGGKGEGYNFPAMRPVGPSETEPGVRMFATPQGAAQSGEWMTGRTVKLKSPIIVEGSKGLSEFKDKLGLDPAVKFKNAEDTKAEWDAITEKATQYAKSTGHDGVVFTQSGEPQSVIDMTKWKKEIGNEATAALKYYRENVGSKTSALRGAQQALTTANPDNIIDNALDKKGAETATNYYKSLDDKGRAALRVATINRAMKLATNSDGVLDPAKVAKYFHDRQESINVFFKGEDRWVLNGFTNLMSEAKAHSAGGGHGLTGSIVLAEAAMEAVKNIGHLGSAVTTAATTFGTLATVGTIARVAATNPQLRYFLVAASDAKPGSPAMEKIYSKVIDLIDKTAAGIAAKQGVKQ